MINTRYYDRMSTNKTSILYNDLRPLSTNKTSSLLTPPPSVMLS